MKRKIVFTGGGSAGHVSVNAALIPEFQKKGWDIFYIGSYEGIERSIINTNFPEVKYLSVPVGKLRRYFAWKNLSDPILVIKGFLESRSILQEINPDFIFSKGGFVSVPVVSAGRSLKIPVIIHESDYTPGLANKLVFPFSKAICTTFKETGQFLKGSKSLHVGAVLREGIFQGEARKGLEICGFTGLKPILAVMGGSLGSAKINKLIERNLPVLLEKYDIIHFCGKGNINEALRQAGYAPFEFVNKGLFDLVTASSVVVSRAGSNSIFEFLALEKPMLLIPLSSKASRGDQIINAKSFEKAGYSRVIEEEQLTDELFLKEIAYLAQNREQIQNRMSRNKEFKRSNEMYELLVKQIDKISAAQ
ncbi:UDP-N-acetylglucosamine--N-acetylmuramyl-(pentapeptide) pyrophosphoryl-undecaprenol N-acetylglucosamine transferase [Peribacillus deserti]|uniref:UDP-N-acetylglucosamine--N-acetylmuramyl-(pentapeptide) pyrophosphoryl-undecaprenol N-acetylglucosamine transferase n=1 Tax=Peribacillus deserti TaxID=673318 RepID=A0ABS2QH77_9BACI|nr:undecaprenyldiphospho-muramoylpentapeptide beta-N-acetylglucosaminyltransferase [Peribacillus deserti]MBM7692508.1 UDP-N-acetylglucosamine--N-acetylmuramyl-(pentapeptide) pyrophosphoryl-undecaprenol N-acetylglucosamine transferase [Peribacillus deserti]